MTGVSCEVCDQYRPCVRVVVSCGLEVSACHVCLSESDCPTCEEEAETDEPPSPASVPLNHD